MTSIRMEPWTMLAADIGVLNPLPDIQTVQYVHSGVTVSPRVSEEEKKYIGYGMVPGILPYQIQDGYTRERKTRTFHAVVLENALLKAVFLPEVGGRLWSLYHKAAKRELLHVNPVLQPCHLALRNAWFAGGVEWNVGIKGHNPYTCDPLHTEIVEQDGLRLLRMYEYERIRRCVYCIEAYLPDDSEALYVKVRIQNTSGGETPMYWWSNIAVPETASTRVIAPADEALESFYSGTSYWLDKASIPLDDGIDQSYPTRLGRSTDYFYCVPKTRKKWICAVEQDGRGLFETSTDTLYGKKMFHWGTKQGGRHWQEYLSTPNHNYIEIQAGLARTQLEHIPMQKDDTWEFMEAYGMAEASPDALHGEWPKAQETAEDAINHALRGVTPAMMLTDEHWRKASETAGQPIMTGSGWGALENLRRKSAGEAPLSNVYAFPDSSLGAEQMNWLELLKTGDFSDRPVQNPPASYMTDRAWLPLLEKATGWYGVLQYGVALYGLGDSEGAEAAFFRSNSLRENGWACRNIARLEKLKGHQAEAEKWLSQAAQLLPWDRHIAEEYAILLNEDGRGSTRYLALYDSLPEDVRFHPRMVLQKIIALCRTGQCEKAQAMLDDGLVLPDIREGEGSLADVWEEVQQARMQRGLPRKELPFEMDFRMH